MLYTVAAVRWLDSTLANNQRDKNELKDLTPTWGYSCGFIVGETDDYITLSGSIFDDGDGRQSISIPKFAVSNIRRWEVTLRSIKEKHAIKEG